MRQRNTRSKGRSPRHYRPDNGAAIAKLDRRRSMLGVSHEQLAARAGLAIRTWARMRADGRAWRRHVMAVRMALRSIEKELAAMDGQYEVDE